MDASSEITVHYRKLLIKLSKPPYIAKVMGVHYAKNCHCLGVLTSGLDAE